MTNLQQPESILDAYVGIVRAKFECAYSNKCGGAGREEFYCGITNDLERRKGEHNVASFVCTHKCHSFGVAQEVEQELHELGYDTGEQLGNGAEDSVYVYMYKMRPNTKP